VKNKGERSCKSRPKIETNFSKLSGLDCSHHTDLISTRLLDEPEGRKARTIILFITVSVTIDTVKIEKKF